MIASANVSVAKEPRAMKLLLRVAMGSANMGPLATTEPLIKMLPLAPS